MSVLDLSLEALVKDLCPGLGGWKNWTSGARSLSDILIVGRSTRGLMKKALTAGKERGEITLTQKQNMRKKPRNCSTYFRIDGGKQRLSMLPYVRAEGQPTTTCCWSCSSTRPFVSALTSAIWHGLHAILLKNLEEVGAFTLESGGLCHGGHADWLLAGVSSPVWKLMKCCGNNQ